MHLGEFRRARRVRGLSATIAVATALIAGAGVVVPRLASAAPPPPAMRLAGVDRYATAAAVSRADHPDGAPAAVVTTGESFADALGAGPLAAALGGPLLLTASQVLPPATATELARLHPAKILVVGGPAAVSPAVAAALATMAPVTRLAGADRYATAAAVAQLGFPSRPTRVYVASGTAFPDALSAGAAAAASHGAVLLTSANVLPGPTAVALVALAPTSASVVGGPAAIGDTVIATMTTLSGTAPTRLAGADRYATAAAVAASQFPSAGTVVVASGMSFADALAGGPSAAQASAPLLLTDPRCLPAPTADEIAAVAATTMVVLGGETAVSSAAASGAPCAPPPPPAVAGSGYAWAYENETPVALAVHRSGLTEAAQYQLISARPTVFTDVPGMRAVNPQLRLLAYMNGAFAQKTEGTTYPDDWYAHDAAGNKIRSNGYGNYLMQITNEGWVESRVGACAALLAQSGYDGCLLDMLGTAPLTAGYATGVPINPATLLPWTKPDWLAATSALAARVKAGVAPALVFGNGLDNGPKYFNTAAPTSQLLDVLDGGVSEGWLRAPTDPLTQWPSETAWRQNLDMLTDAGARGRTVLVLPKVWAAGTDDEKTAWHRFALGSFLLANDGHSLFTFSFGKDTDATAGSSWWELKLGPALGAYRKVTTFYQRDFAAGLVLVNPTASPVEVPLAQPYRDLAGAIVSTVALSPHGAEVLTTP